MRDLIVRFIWFATVALGVWGGIVLLEKHVGKDSDRDEAIARGLMGRDAPVLIHGGQKAICDTLWVHESGKTANGGWSVGYDYPPGTPDPHPEIRDGWYTESDTIGFANDWAIIERLDKLVERVEQLERKAK